eukprot:SRR837773.7401.p1 GENE.SRR837773.7401~~SRR837773.7401.p1  ORF type:complete len:462 (+),score=170.44 SRR837773.7401:68-1387(+)
MDERDMIRANSTSRGQAGDGSAIPALGKGGACLTSVCTFYKSAVYAARIQRAYGIAMVKSIGTLCKLLCYKNLFFGQFSIIDGMIIGCINVKRILPGSSLPGYVLAFAVIASLPLVLFGFALLTQQMGHPAFAAAIACFTGWRAMDLTRADILQKTNHRSKNEAAFKKTSTKQMLLQLLGVIFLIVYGLRMFWLIRNGHVVATSIPAADMSFDIDLKEMFSVPGLTVMLFKFLYTKLTTKLCSTDLLMKAIFDSANDELKVRDENRDDILEEWGKLMDLSVKKYAKSREELEREEEKKERKMDPRTEEKYTFEEFTKKYSNQLSKEEIQAYWDDFLKPAPTKYEERKLKQGKSKFHLKGTKDVKTDGEEEDKGHSDGGMVGKLKSGLTSALPFGKHRSSGKEKEKAEGSAAPADDEPAAGAEAPAAGDDAVGASASGSK